MRQSQRRISRIGHPCSGVMWRKIAVIWPIIGLGWAVPSLAQVGPKTSESAYHDAVERLMTPPSSHDEYVELMRSLHFDGSKGDWTFADGSGQANVTGSLDEKVLYVMRVPPIPSSDGVSLLC
jgi:hypothetical protein